VDGALVLKYSSFVGSMRHAHDVDVAKLRPAFAPVCVRHDVESPDFAARFQLASGRNGPVEQRVELGDALSAGQRFVMFEKGGKAPDDAQRFQVAGDLQKFIQRNAGFLGASTPNIAQDLVRLELAFE